MELAHVSFTYDAAERLIDNFSAKLPEGQILSIIGPNGSGKSTLLKLMMGQLQPTQGQIKLDGQLLKDLNLKQRSKTIAMVSQQHQIYDSVTVKEVVKTGRLPFHSLLSTIPDEEILPFLTQVHLEWAADRQLNALSGGQQQRVWLAAALAQQPKYLFLDEPTTYLDIRYQEELLQLIQELNKNTQMTIVLVLHDINQAFRISQQVWLIKSGRLVMQGAPNELLDVKLLSTTFGLSVQIVDLENYGPYVIQLATP